LRRQIGLWKSGGPWIALIGIVCVVGIPLSEIYMRYERVFYERAWGVLWGHPVNPFNFPGHVGIALDLAFMVCLTFALLIWSWTSGFVMASFARRATWLAATLFYFVVVDFAWLRQYLVSPNPPLRLTLRLILDLLVDAPVVLIALPLYWGAKSALRGSGLKTRWIAGSGAAIAVLTVLLSWLGSWYEMYETPNGSAGRPPVQSLLILSWPVVYLCAGPVRNLLRK
jgi:hypothetical protein